jgi:hypothetical protein
VRIRLGSHFGSSSSGTAAMLGTKIAAMTAMVEILDCILVMLKVMTLFVLSDVVTRISERRGSRKEVQ